MAGKDYGAEVPQILNIHIDIIDHEYSQEFPQGTKRFEIRCRKDIADIRFAFEADKVAVPTEPYRTLMASEIYYEDTLFVRNKSLYVASGSVCVVEFATWR